MTSNSVYYLEFYLTTDLVVIVLAGLQQQKLYSSKYPLPSFQMKVCKFKVSEIHSSKCLKLYM